MPIFYGLRFADTLPNGQPATWTDFAVEPMCFLRGGTLSTGGLSKAQHFKNVAKIMWGPKSKKPFVWHPWAEDMLEEACKNNWIWLSGCASCVAGHTRIPNPITGESPTIQELCESGTAPIVMTIGGPIQAGVPFVKGEAELFEVELSNGSKFAATSEHRVLTPMGFFKVHELNIRQSIWGYDENSTAFRPHVTRPAQTNKVSQGVGLSMSSDAEVFEGCDVMNMHPFIVGRYPAEHTAPAVPGPCSVPVRFPRSATTFPSPSGPIRMQVSNRLVVREPCEPALVAAKSSFGLERESKEAGSAFLANKSDSYFGRLVWPIGPGSHPSAELADTYIGTCQSDVSGVGSREINVANRARSFCGAFSGSGHGETLHHHRDLTRFKTIPLEVVSIRRLPKATFYDLNVPVEHHYFAEGAIHHNSGKTDFMAVWGIVNWMCSPQHTLVLFTSTSLKEARQRVWGSVIQYYSAYCDNKGKPILPGKIIDSVGMIRTVNGMNKYSDKCGIHLITGEKSKERENIGKLIGLKNRRVFLMGDELCELSPALVEAAKSNLISNPEFQMIGASNFKGIYDPFGSESEPRDGWSSINPESTRWETKNGGVCLRFDGTLSPNILEGHDKWPIYNSQTLKRQKEALGEHSAMFWRMCRSFHCPDADANRIYSDADFIRGLVHERVRWQSAPTRWASLDPAFATGGDKAIAYIGSYGMSTEGKWTLQYDKRVEIREDVRKKDESRSLQVAKGYRDLCIAERVAPENAAYDASGGGLPFGSLLGEIWSLKLLGVQFGGAASDRPVSGKDKRPAKDAFVNRVTELWFGGVDYIHSGQIKGVFKEAAEEWKERRYETIKGTTMRVKVESKSDMKLRINRSCDDGDSSLIGVELCRTRFNFVPEGMEGVRKQTNGSFKQRAMLINRVYQNVNYEAEEVAA